MRVAHIALDRDHTLTLYCEADQTAKVDAMFAEVERLRADAEPVAWRFRFPSGKQWHLTEHKPHEYTKRGLHFEPLYTNPTALRAALKETK
jgi:hypothetical protein